MKKSYAGELLSTSTPAQLSSLLKLDPAKTKSWNSEDLRALVRHQQQAPLEFDLAAVKLSDPDAQAARDSLAEARRLNLFTFWDLFQAPDPPIPLLKLSQKFFKQNFAKSLKNSPEQLVAYLFYLLSILVARIRKGAKISKLSDDDVLHGIQSMAGREWVDKQIRELLDAGRERLEGGYPG